MIRIKCRGTFNKTKNFLNKAVTFNYREFLEYYGQVGVGALRNATPVRTGLTSESWYYEIIEDKDTISISWNNRNVNDGVNIAVIIQYGHGTKNGGYVVGKDYINPIIQPIFDNIAENVWKEVVK